MRATDTTAARKLRSPACTIAQVMAATCATLGCTSDDIKGTSRGGLLCREIFIMAAVRLTWATLKEIGEACDRGPQSIDMIWKRVKRKCDAGTEFGLTYAQLAEEVERELAGGVKEHAR